MIKYPVYKPDLTGSERDFVLECIDSTWISSKGHFVDRFENQFAAYQGIKYAVAVCNGTMALHAALLALGIGPGDEVIVPTLTYIASVNAITYTGATPVFADSHANSWQVDPNDVKRCLSSRTRAIMAVHLYGHPCDMDDLMALIDKRRLYLIEDCAEAIGSEYDGRRVGNYGDVSCFSFFGNKTITTGEGGMVVTNSNAIADRVRRIKGQGLAPNREYWHDLVGYNYRMTNIAAAIGCAQLERIEDIIKRKIAIAHTYRRKLEGVPVHFHQCAANTKHTFWMCSILTENASDREPLREHLKAYGIETRPLLFPVHTMPIYPGQPGDFPVAEDLSARGINLPSYPGLNDNDIDYITGKTKEYYGG
jgi:perosamine synthetase